MQSTTHLICLGYFANEIWQPLEINENNGCGTKRPQKLTLLYNIALVPQGNNLTDVHVSNLVPIL